MTQLAELATAVVGVMIGLVTLLGLGVRYVLFPYLADKLVAPILDRLDALAHRMEGLASDVVVGARMYEGHISASERDRSALWEAVTELRDRTTPRHRRTRRKDHA